jgi:hypothetical protein
LSAKKASVPAPTACATCGAAETALTLVSIGPEDLTVCPVCAAQLASAGFVWH